MNPTLTLIQEHLPLLGFELEAPDENGFFWANHEVRPSVLVSEVYGGVAFGAPFGPQELKDPSASYSLVNRVNSRLTLARAYFDEDVHLSFEAWLPGGTSKEGITLFLDVFARDVSEAMALIIAESSPK